MLEMRQAMDLLDQFYYNDKVHVSGLLTDELQRTPEIDSFPFIVIEEPLFHLMYIYYNLSMT